MEEKSIRNFFCSSCCLEWLKPEPHNEKMLQQIKEEYESQKNRQSKSPILPVSSIQENRKTKISENESQMETCDNLQVCMICDTEFVQKIDFKQNNKPINKVDKAFTLIFLLRVRYF